MDVLADDVVRIMLVVVTESTVRPLIYLRLCLDRATVRYADYAKAWVLIVMFRARFGIYYCASVVIEYCTAD